MPVTGLIILPFSPGVTSLSSSFISHLSYLYPAEAHEPWHVDHRLFVSTSSLLPGADPKQRQYTQMLTTSHRPSSTFVGTRAPAINDPAGISIPSSFQDSFAQLILSKLQPQWAHRQSVLLDGTSINLPVKDGGRWTIRIGDLKISGGAGRPGGSSTTGTIKGMLVELQYQEQGASKPDLTSAEVVMEYNSLFRSLLKAHFKDVADYKFDEVKFALRNTLEGTAEPPRVGKDVPDGYDMAALYMDVLRR